MIGEVSIYTSCRDRLIGSAVLFFALSLVIVLRSWPTFAYPGFYLEDSPHFFTFYYGAKRAFSEIFHMPGTDYMTLIIEVVAWLAAFLDVRVQPYAYTFFSLFIGVTTCVLSIWLNLFKRAEFLVLTPLVLALVGIGRVSYYAVMVGSAWIMMILLFTLMLMKVPKSTPWMVLHALSMVVLCWAHPYSVIAVPLSVLIMVLYRDPKRSAILGLVMLSATAYFLFATDKEVADLQGFWDFAVFCTMLSKYYDVLIHGVVFLGFFERVPVTLSILLWILIAGALIYVKDREVFRTSLILFFIILSALSVYYLSNRQVIFRSEGPGILTRYLLIPFYFWILFVSYCTEKVLIKLEAGILARGAVSVSCLVLILGYNLVNRQNFVFQREDPKAVSVFTETVAHYETLARGWKKQYIKIRLKKDKYMGALLLEAVIGDKSPSSKNMGQDQETLWDPESGFIVVPQ